MSEFQSMVSGALKAIYEGDYLATQVLADFLADHGDSRHLKLRRRLKRFLADRARWEDALARITAAPAYRSEDVKQRAISGCEFCIRHELELWVSYFLRLMSVAAGRPLPRPRVNTGYLAIEPPQ